MKLMNLGVTLSLIWLVAMAVTSSAQNPVIDTFGHPLRRGTKYYIKPANPNSGGRITLINRCGDHCPSYVGQENFSGHRGLPVTFSPQDRHENTVRETRNFRVSFTEVRDNCVRLKTWWLGQRNDATGKYLIVTGDNAGYSNYFYITKGRDRNTYHIQWCPSELCHTCRFPYCGPLGGVHEDGKKYLG